VVEPTWKMVGVDGFGGAYWRRPHAYLDDTVQQGMSLFAMTPKHQVKEGLTRLQIDLSTGEWHQLAMSTRNGPRVTARDGSRMLIANFDGA
jgi:hypothetical protein